VLPGSWRELVDLWKQKKPLQARKLEEVRPLAYGPDKIVVAVDAQSFASKSLLNESEQNLIAQEFKALFGFTGRLVVQSAEQAASVEQATPTAESLLEIKSREADLRREQLMTQAR